MPDSCLGTSTETSQSTGTGNHVIFILVEVVISIQSTQSNALIAGLLCPGIYCDGAQPPHAGSCPDHQYGIYQVIWSVRVWLFLFYPCRWKGAIAAAMSMILFAFLPLNRAVPRRNSMMDTGLVRYLAEDRGRPACRCWGLVSKLVWAECKIPIPWS